MEHQSTKIPRLREARYGRNQTTCIELRRPSRIHVENQQPSQMKRTISLTQLVQYKPLTPEQFTVKYKRNDKKFCKKSCIICGMRRPQLRMKSIKIDQSKVESSSICTQTTPSENQTEVWNGDAETKILRPTNIDSKEFQGQFEQQRNRRNMLRSLISFGAWFSLLMAILAIAAVFIIKRIDVLKWVTRKQLRHPKTILEKMLSYFHRERVLSETSNRSVTIANVPRIELLLLGLTLLLTLGIDDTY